MNRELYGAWFAGFIRKFRQLRRGRERRSRAGTSGCGCRSRMARAEGTNGITNHVQPNRCCRPRPEDINKSRKQGSCPKKPSNYAGKSSGNPATAGTKHSPCAAEVWRVSCSSRFFFFIVRHKIMFYILYIFMAGGRAVQGRGWREAAGKGLLGWGAGPAQGGQECGVGGWPHKEGAGADEWGVKRPDVCRRDGLGCWIPKAD